MERFRYLFDRYVAKTATIAERLEFQELLQLQEYDVELKLLIDSYFSTFVAAPHEPALPLPNGMLSAILSANDTGKPAKQVVRVKLWFRMAMAAAVVLIVSVIYLFSYHRVSPTDDAKLTAQDVAPGKMGATLTLANGKKIELTNIPNGQLAKEAGVLISKSANGQLIYEIKNVGTETSGSNTLSTAKGETYQLHLPDGSVVWLNAASSLTYTTGLKAHGKRRVKLQGEGYFEIAKDKAHPFVVQTNGQEVEVLGTHFNVNAYADEAAVATTLLEGAVKVTSKSNQLLLKPGEQALNNGKAIKVAKVDVENVIDWKQGDFYFEHVDFRSVMRKIGRWYDVEIIYDRSVPERITSNGLISRNNKLSAVLKSIEKSGQVHFKIDGKKVYVTE